MRHFTFGLEEIELGLADLDLASKNKVILTPFTLTFICHPGNIGRNSSRRSTLLLGREQTGVDLNLNLS